MSARAVHRLRCACGEVECAGYGAPIGTAVCYCDDCQAAARAIEALPGAVPVADPDGGTALTLFDTRNFAVVRGEDKLVAHRLGDTSPTRRMVAGCCNSAMFLTFDRGPYWVSTMRNRFTGPLPAIEFRQMTKYRANDLPWPDAAPRSRGFAPRFILRVTVAGVARQFRRRATIAA
ncbi:MAG: hypothetical protein H7241_11505 [Novosphingobium sp.]|nr:hypothetical protein [Novosphingobium sp.]